MKRKSIILWGLIVLFILSLSLTIFAKEQVYDFRKTNWGMNKEQVKATEKKKSDYECDTLVAYKVNISGYDFLCVYEFIQNKLYKSMYIFAGSISEKGNIIFGEAHTNKNDYIDDYKNLKKLLTKKYGKPKLDRVIWKNDLYKDDPNDWGLAISIGYLLYGVTWETPTTEIGLILGGDNYKIRLVIGYDSKELKDWVKKIKEEKTKSEF